MNQATSSTSRPSSSFASFCYASILLQAALAALLMTAGRAHADAAPRPDGDAAVPVAAHRLGQHPAVLVHARGQQLDPNRFIVQPPASVTWTFGPAAGEAGVLLATDSSATHRPQPAVASR